MNKYIFIIGLLGTPALANAEQTSFFIGAKGGYQWAQDDNYHHSDPEGALFGVYGGLQFTPAWSWDIGYQYHDTLKADVTSINVDTWLIESAVRYDWYLQDNLSLYGRLGVAYWDMEKTVHSSGKLEANGFSPIAELGVNYTFNPNFRMSLGYQYIDSIGKSNTGQYDSHGAMLGFTYTFAKQAKQKVVVTPPLPPVPTEEKAKPIPKKMTSSSQRMNNLFKVDSQELSDDFVEQLSKVIATLTRYPQSRVEIAGHTDSTGSATYNQFLSEWRAQAVANKLVELGVSPTQIDVKGHGETRPIADNETPEGRSENRRVDVTLPEFNYYK